MSATEKPVTELTPKTNTSALTGKAIVTYSKTDGSADAFDGDRLKTMLDNIDERTPLHRITLEANTGLVLYGSVLVSVIGGMEASVNHTFIVNTEDDGGWVTLLTSPKLDGLESWINFYFDDDWQIVLWAEAESGGVTVTVCDLDGSFNGTITTTKPTEEIDLNVIAVENSLNELDTRKLDKLIGGTEGNIVITKQDGTVEDSGVSLGSLRAAGISEGIADSISAGTAQEIVFRQSGGDGVNYIKRFKGKTLAWNQSVDDSGVAASGLNNGINYTFADHLFTAVNGTASATSFSDFALGYTRFSIISGHKYYLGKAFAPASSSAFLQVFSSQLNNWSATIGTSTAAIFTAPGDATDVLIRLRVASGTTVNNIKWFQTVVDLTLLYGTEIDGLTNEQILAKFESDFGTGYHEYNAGTLISNDAEELETEGFNQWDEEWEVGVLDANGQNLSDNTRIRSKEYTPVFPSTNYYFKSQNALIIYWYDANKTVISYTSGNNFIVESPSGARYCRFYVYSTTYGTTYANDICINLSDASKNGTYEPYWKRTINLGLDSFKVKDGQGNVLTITGGLKSAGSVYDEIVGNKYIKRVGEYTFKGNEGWTKNGTAPQYTSRVGLFVGRNRSSNYWGDSANVLHPKLITASQAAIYAGSVTNAIGFSDSTTADTVVIDEVAYTNIATLLTGTTAYYELATPIEYELVEPIPNAILVDELGTEKAVFPEHEDGSPSAPLCTDSNYSIGVAKLVSIVKSLSDESNG